MNGAACQNGMEVKQYQMRKKVFLVKAIAWMTITARQLTYLGR
jgi:hypothetical protein